jgi:hypothetical protein
LSVVAITVVKGQADEAVLEIALQQAAVHLIEADKLEASSPQQAERIVQELRRDFQVMIGLKCVAPRGPDVMQGQDCANAAPEATQQTVRTGEIERFQARSNNRPPQRNTPKDVAT